MMRKILFVGLAIMAGLIFLPADSLAHGVGYKHSELKAVPLEFFYSTGEKMSYCEARVFSPHDEKFAAQTGRTDEQGRFAFIPDAAGEWRVIVRDNEGHQCTAEIVISDEWLVVSESVNPSQEESSLPQGMELFIRALLGVSIIFNVAMIIRWRSGHAH